MKRPVTTAALRFDLLGEAFRAGQAVYRTGLLAHINRGRRALGRPAVDWPRVGPTPYTVAWQSGAARLLHYAPPAVSVQSAGAPVLLVCSLINRAYILDLLDDRSVVRRLREAGRDVWLLDWGEAAPEDADKGLAHYALDVLPRAAEVVRKETSTLAPHVVGYCMGGTLSLMAIGAGVLPAASLVAIATPVDLHDEGLLSQWCRAPGFDPEEVVRVYGNAPPHLLQPAFKMLDPVGVATKLVHLDDKLEDDEFLRFFLAMETWLEDSVPFPGQAFLEWVRLYQDNLLMQGRFSLGDRELELGSITCPILTLVAESDYITTRASALALPSLTPRAEHQTFEVKGGHIGLSTSSAAQRILWPRVAEWMATHEQSGTREQPAAKPPTADAQPAAKQGRDEQPANPAEPVVRPPATPVREKAAAPDKGVSGVNKKRKRRS